MCGYPPARQPSLSHYQPDAGHSAQSLTETFRLAALSATYPAGVPSDRTACAGTETQSDLYRAIADAASWNRLLTRSGKRQRNAHMPMVARDRYCNISGYYPGFVDFSGIQRQRGFYAAMHSTGQHGGSLRRAGRNVTQSGKTS